MIDKTKLQDHLWSKCLTLSIELQYSKSKSKRAQYDALAEVWTGIKDGEFDFNPCIETTESHSPKGTEAGGKP